MTFSHYFRSGGARTAIDTMSACAPIDCGHELVRLGGPADGGYLVPNDLDGVLALFSPGVAESSSFELEFARRGTPCFLADRSVPGPQLNHPLFHFTRKHLGTFNDSQTMRLDDWVDAHSPGSGISCCRWISKEPSTAFFRIVPTNSYSVLESSSSSYITVHASSARGAINPSSPSSSGSPRVTPLCTFMPTIRPLPGDGWACGCIRYLSSHSFVVTD